MCSVRLRSPQESTGRHQITATEIATTGLAKNKHHENNPIRFPDVVRPRHAVGGRASGVQVQPSLDVETRQARVAPGLACRACKIV